MPMGALQAHLKKPRVQALLAALAFLLTTTALNVLPDLLNQDHTSPVALPLPAAPAR